MLKNIRADIAATAILRKFAENRTDMKEIKDNALSIANYFVELAKRDSKNIRLLKLMKLVYIAHGYILAMLDRSVLDPRFDKVEAWRYGPVIPSVYHSFKQYRDNAITDKAVVMVGEEPNIVFVTPELKDKEARKICDFVWKRYGEWTDSSLVSMLHQKGSPWQYVYEEGRNKEILDLYTKVYYKRMVEILMDNANGKA